MARQSSYVKLEKSFARELRSEVLHSENTTDVKNCFSQIAGKFLRKAFDSQIDILDKDVILDPSAESKFTFSDKIMSDGNFKTGVKESDIKQILERFANAAEHRYRHLSKNPLKSDLKIRSAQMVA